MILLPWSACLFALLNANIVTDAMITVDTQMAMTAIMPGT